MGSVWRSFVGNLRLIVRPTHEHNHFSGQLTTATTFVRLPFFVAMPHTCFLTCIFGCGLMCSLRRTRSCSKAPDLASTPSVRARSRPTHCMRVLLCADSVRRCRSRQSSCHGLAQSVRRGDCQRPIHQALLKVVPSASGGVGRWPLLKPSFFFRSFFASILKLLRFLSYRASEPRR